MTCDGDLGGIWLPAAGGSLDYKPIRCNDGQEHDGPCSYADPRSGLMVTRYQPPTVTVDNRGCVIDAP